MDKAKIKDNLNALWMSCEEAVTGVWDKSDSGFRDMQACIEDIARELEMEIPIETE